MPIRSALPLALILIVAASGCAGDDSATSDTDASTGGSGSTTDTSGGDDGRQYYDGDASAALGAAGNQARCSTCHSMDGTQPGFSGNTFKDIAYHDSFKGGDADLRGAVNACVTGWMGGAELAADAPAYVALEGYLQSISDPNAKTPNALAPEVLADEAAYEDAYAGGDAAAGAAKYTQECAICHDAGLQVGPIAAYPKATLAAYTVGRIAQKVRTSGPPPSGMNDGTDSTPGPMPFFEPKDLSAADLADIIAHIKG